jgi:hypothetical protein
MSDTGINSSDLSSTASIANKIGESFYPNGEVVITGTTMSRQPYEDRSLRSADPVKIIQGDGLYRNPAFAINAYAQSTQSAMHGIVASMSDLNDDIKIADPNDPRGTPLTGAAAKMEIAKNSMLVTGYAPSGFSESIRALNNSVINSTVQPTDSDLAYVTSEMGATVAEKTSGYIPSSEPGMVLNGGSRAIALDSLLSDQEKEVYATKVAQLNNKANFNGSVSAFTIDFNTNKEGQNLSSLGFAINQEPSYISGSMQALPVDPNLLGSGSKKCHISAALIEMMLQVTNTMHVQGGTGVRTLVGPNFSLLTAENNSVSDHAFGRGFDIMAVGNSAIPVTALSKNIDTYRQGLHLLLTTLNGLTQDLHPDLIVVHDQLMAELGIAESGLEGANAAVRTKYPNLGKFVNFAVDSSHRDHIHVSFSPQRAGSFITPEIATAITGVSFTAEDAKGGISMDKFKQNFFGKPNASLSTDELMALLSTSGLFSLEVSAIFTAIAEREANIQPAAINTNRNTGDFSVGMFQINLLPKAHGDKTFYLKYNASGQPEDSTALGYKLAYSIDSDNNPKTLADKVQNQATQATVDRRVWIPYNQVWMLGVTAVGSVEVAKRAKTNEPIDRYIFRPWGDYGTEIIPGFIFKTKFSTALSVYLNRGGTDANLRKWIRTNIPKESRAYKYIEGWMGGSVYKEDGSVL